MGMKEKKEQGPSAKYPGKSEDSTRQDFAHVEQLLRKDMMSEVDYLVSSKDDNENSVRRPNTLFFSDDEEEDITPPKPNTPFFSDIKEEDHLPAKPSTPFFSEDEDVISQNNLIVKVHISEEEKNNNDYVLNESDINYPPEERNTSLLGSYDDQQMKNFYCQGG